MRARILSKAQAEIIGGVLAIAVLLMAISTILYATFALMSSSSTNISKRAQFEVERNSERISVVYDANNYKCIVNNTGSVDITIVRQWTNGMFTEIKKDLNRGRGLNFSLSSAPDYIVTSRGNVFPVKSECQSQVANQAQVVNTVEQYISAIPIGAPFTSQNLVATTRITSDRACIVVGYRYETSSQDTPLALVYNKSKNTILRHQCKPESESTYGWSNYTPSSIQLPQGVNDISDIDSNMVKEIVVVSSTSPLAPMSFSGKGNVYVNMTFYNITYIPNITDTVAIYYKFVVYVPGGGVAQQVGLSASVSLKSLKDGSKFTSAGSVITAPSRSGVVAVVGWAAFPKFLYNFSEGFYSISVVLNMNIASSVTVSQVNLEYLAIVGGQILWPPKPS
ncbi:MAG: hypothetical protein QXT53_00220 [Ignisphaera sp.]